MATASPTSPWAHREPAATRAGCLIFKSNGSSGPAFAGCAPVDPGPGPGPGPGPVPVPAAAVRPLADPTRTRSPHPGGRIASLAKRTLTLKSSKKKVKVAKLLDLTGKLRASKSKRACEAKQKVAIQRFDPANGSWPTVDVAVTRRNGTFVVQARPIVPRSLLYRAIVKQTKRCSGATSGRVRVKVTS